MEKKQQKGKKVPIRQCAGCGEHFPKKELIRIVRCPDGRVELDLVGKKSGRGVYLCKSAACFKKARKTRKIERELECPISEEIYDSIEQTLEAESASGTAK